MRDLSFQQIDAAQYDAFSSTHPQGNYQQTSDMARVREATGTEVGYHGVFEDGELVAATLLEVHRFRLSTFAEIHDGPLVDLADTELTKFLFESLKDHAKGLGAQQLAITPELPWRVRDAEGKELPDDPDEASWPKLVPHDVPTRAQQTAFDNLVSCGFEHDGFDQAYTAVPRWRFVKDLRDVKDEQALLATYAKNTKRNVRIAANSCVKVERLSREELGMFHDICELSCEKQGFDNRPTEYFELLFDTLGEKAEFLGAFIDARAFLASWEDKRDAFAAEVARLNKLEEDKGPLSPKNEKKRTDQQSKYEASLARVQKAQEYLDEDGERILAAVALFVDHPRERVYLFSGSDPKYAKFYAATAIQHHVMCECLEKGINRYNFYGINGVFDDPHDPGRGLLEFKQGFGGYVEEMMGSFTLPVRPVSYAVKQLAHKVLGR